MTDSTAPPSRGMTGFVVDADTEGIILGKKEINMGEDSGDAADRPTMLRYPDGHVSRRHRAAGECPRGGRRGFQKWVELVLADVVAMKAFDITRPLVAAAAVGLAQSALEEATRYAQEREASLSR